MEPDQPESSPASKAAGGSVIADLLSSRKKNGPTGAGESDLDIHQARRSSGIALEDVQADGTSSDADWFDRRTYERLEKNQPQVPNQRRGHFALKVWAANVLFTLLLLGGFGIMLHRFYQDRIESRIGKLSQEVVSFSPSIQSQISDAERASATTSRDVASLHAEINALRGELEKLTQQTATATQQLATTADSLSKLQTQVDTLAKEPGIKEEALKPLQSRLQALDTQITDLSVLMKQVDTKAIAAAARSSASSQPTESLPPPTSANDELVLLKERNRLTMRADEAMATGKAAPLRALWESLRDPELANLTHAAAAEIIRVQNHLDHLTRLPPDYTLPVKEYFPAATSEKDSDLPITSLITLLLDQQKPLAARARAARLLSGRKTTEVGEALLKAMRTDPELDVVKEAQHSMHATFKFAVPLFDILSADAWWSRNKDGSTPAQTTPPAKGSSAPKP